MRIAVKDNEDLVNELIQFPVQRTSCPLCNKVLVAHPWIDCDMPAEAPINAWTVLTARIDACYFRQNITPITSLHITPPTRPYPWPRPRRPEGQ